MALNESQTRNALSRPDIDSVVTEGWRQRPFPIQGQGNRNVVQVVVKRSVLDAICNHGLSRTDVEVCGVLVGNSYQDERGPFIYIEAMIQGEHSDNKVAQVTFTSETWNHIQDEMDQYFDGKRILGWYHTHPGFGIFLSPMDMFIHENFFNESDQLALVYDPLKGEDGLFVWRGGKAELHQYLVEEDVESSLVNAGKSESVSKPMLTATAQINNENMPSRSRRFERRNGLLEWCIIATAVFAFVWPFLVARLDLAPMVQPISPEVDTSDSVPTVVPADANPNVQKTPQPDVPPSNGTKKFPPNGYPNKSPNPQMRGEGLAPVSPGQDENMYPRSSPRSPKPADDNTFKGNTNKAPIPIPEKTSFDLGEDIVRERCD